MLLPWHSISYTFPIAFSFAPQKYKNIVYPTTFLQKKQAHPIKLVCLLDLLLSFKAFTALFSECETRYCKAQRNRSPVFLIFLQGRRCQSTASKKFYKRWSGYMTIHLRTKLLTYASALMSV